MVRQLKVAEAAGRLNSKLRTYLRPGTLVVAEVGYQPLERAEANLVFQVISKRYEKGSIVLTSNKTFSKAHTFPANLCQAAPKPYGFRQERGCCCMIERCWSNW